MIRCFERKETQVARRIAYCTIASANYLSRVEVLKNSLHAHNPSSILHVLLCEHPDVCRSISGATGFTFISPDQVCSGWLHMAFYYNITEFNTALKPFLIDFLFEYGYDVIIYFDPDIEIFGSLNDLEDLMQDKDLILTPHICNPIGMDGFAPTIDTFIRAGQFNLGFIAVSNTAETRPVLKWWQDVCFEHCILHPYHRLFVDQFWADILPSFIQNFFCLRDAAYNMAYWNIFQRRLVHQNGRWLTDSGELKFFHFSGFLKNDLRKVSMHQNRVVAEVGSDLHTMMAHYLERITSAKWSRYDTCHYSFETYSNGKRILPNERKAFLNIGAKERNIIYNPFEHPSTIRRLGRTNIYHSNQYINTFHYRCDQLCRYIICACNEYVNSVKVKGCVSTNLYVMRYLYRKAMDKIR